MEPITCEAVFNEWSQEHLEILAFEKGLNIRSRKSSDRKQQLVDAISILTRESGNRLLISQFDKDALLKLTEKLPETLMKKNGNNPNAKTTMVKRLNEVVCEVGGMVHFLTSEEYWTANEQKDMLRGIIGFLGSDEILGSSRKRLAAQATEALETFFLQNILSVCPAGFLRNVCEVIDIYHGGCSSSTVLADLIINGLHYEPEYTSTPDEPYYSKKPKSVNKKCNKSDLTLWFTVTELKAFCDDHNLKNAGKKSEIAERIIAYFDPEKENDMLMKGSKKVRKSAGRKKRTSRTPVEVTQKSKKMTKNSKKKVQKTKRDEDPMDFSSSFDSISEMSE
eukprot:TRINITY_DN330_c1_g1_i1.p1 TRINITY_DN330_c1_g1~~TRINITY_DN330_c1_g1_i1.p1  ORF type:complete len:362 (+),score=90.22 TRINITY_DN330_c1_g1_i1:80-1087(+)